MTQRRVRFSPSPTGMFHVGGARTALFNWLFARQEEGSRYILRIEDTDEARGAPEWTEMIHRSMEWLGLDWDEVYPQSARFEEHREQALSLIGDHAYYCDCTQDTLAARKAGRGEKTPGYDGFCRDRGLQAGPGTAVRFRTPDEGAIRFTDLVKGDIEIAGAAVEDFVILRANGTPLYVFANCMDDVADGITHVVRGDDHLSNVPKQILLRRAFGAPEPAWAHLPLIVNEQRKKLSKRRDKVALEAYALEGYLPEAMVNYLGTLGWSPPGDEEIVPLEVMIKEFRLDDVVPSPAAFDEKKLAAFNGHYIRALPVSEFVTRARPFFDHPVLETMAEHVQTRVDRLGEVGDQLGFFAVELPEIDGAAWEKATGKGTPAADVLVAVRDSAPPAWTAEEIRTWLDEIAEAAAIKSRAVHAVVRVAVTGKGFGPPLFESLEVFVRERTVLRAQAALDRLGG